MDKLWLTLGALYDPTEKKPSYVAMYLTSKSWGFSTGVEREDWLDLHSNFS